MSLPCYKTVLVCVCPLLTSPAALSAPTDAPKPQFQEKTTLNVNHAILHVELARTALEHRTGLMHRRQLDWNQGMLFRFSPARPVTFWMKNTLFDIDAAFVDACGYVVNIEPMKAGTLTLHPSRGTVAWAIETKAGWFRSVGLDINDRIESLILDTCKKP